MISGFFRLQDYSQARLSRHRAGSIERRRSPQASKIAIVKVGGLRSVLADQYERICSQDLTAIRSSHQSRNNTSEMEKANGTKDQRSHFLNKRYDQEILCCGRRPVKAIG